MTLLQRYGERLAVRDGGWRCFYCHRPLDPGHGRVVELLYSYIHHYRGFGYAHPCRRFEHYHDAPTVDHVTPKSQGGSNAFDNLVLCCRPCNRQKGATSPTALDLEA